MAAEARELRTARLEGANEQIDRRLGAVESRLFAVEVCLSSPEQRMDAGFAQLRADFHTEIHGEAGSLRNEMTGLRHEMQRQFYWLMGAVGVLGALMISGFLQLGLGLSGH